MKISIEYGLIYLEVGVFLCEYIMFLGKILEVEGSKINYNLKGIIEIKEEKKK